MDRLCHGVTTNPDWMGYLGIIQWDQHKSSVQSVVPYNVILFWMLFGKPPPRIIFSRKQHGSFRLLRAVSCGQVYCSKTYRSQDGQLSIQYLIDVCKLHMQRFKSESAHVMRVFMIAATTGCAPTERMTLALESPSDSILG